jgi:hypothetical protein
MKHSIITACIFSVALISCNNADTKKDDVSKTDSSTTTDVKKDAAPSAPVDSATMMKNWAAYMTPGEQHKMMASWNGTWNGEVSMWHMPGTEPQKSTATSVNTMIMGGRYPQSKTTGNMMGMPFEGTSIMGYDNARKVFISTWVDNMGTGIMVLEGPWNDATKTIELKGTTVDPSAGDGKLCNIRETFKVIDDKTQLMEMYGPDPSGKEFKMMEIKLTKK